jgi:hypothetical protein
MKRNIVLVEVMWIGIIFDSGPDPTFHSDADPDPDPTPSVNMLEIKKIFVDFYSQQSPSRKLYTVINFSSAP